MHDDGEGDHAMRDEAMSDDPMPSGEPGAEGAGSDPMADLALRGDAVGRIALALRQPVDLGLDVDRAVMAALRAAPLMVRTGRAPAPPRRRGAWSWLVRPQSVRLSVSPLGALAAAGIAIAAIFGLRREREGQRLDPRLAGTDEHRVPGVTGEYAAVPDAQRRTGEQPVVQTAPVSRTRDTVFVTRFMFVGAQAKQVALVGDFNDWDQGAMPLKKLQNGVWTVEVELPPGRYNYAFLVDGERWLADPAAPRAVGDDFGRPSSVVTVRRIDA